MRKTILTLMFTCMFCFTALAPAFAGNVAIPAAEKIANMETVLYGAPKTGSLLERMDSIEAEVYGVVTSDAVLDRIDNMYDYLKGVDGNGEASFATQLNVVEWRFNESMSGGPAAARIGAVEELLNGAVQTGSLSTRLENLLVLASYDGGIVPVETSTLPKDSIIKIEFTEELGNRLNKEGDEVNFKVADNLYVNDVLVLPKGATGKGKIKKVVQPGIFGKDGRVDIEFSYVYAVDGNKIPVVLGDLAEQQAKTIAGAAGASIGGMVILGPVGVVGGAFVKGSSVVIPVGSATFVQTAEDTSIQGVIYQG